ncbi:MAG: NAD-dependent epimerase/dehydratase family protein [Burkholderiales bacterium]
MAAHVSGLAGDSLKCRVADDKHVNLEHCVKALVTGARGFVGRHLCRALRGAGHEVFGLGHGAWDAADRAAWGLSDWINAEVSAANLDAAAARNGRPEAILHLAGGSAVGPSFQTPGEDFRRSVAATADLLEWVRLHAPETAVVLASSAAVYGRGHAGPIAEGAACRPYSPYGFDKRMAELLMESYAHSFGCRTAIVRLFSVYGPELRKQLLWDACVRLSSTSGALQLGGTGDELRDWIHVHDAGRVLTAALGIASDRCPIVNGGTGIGTCVRDIAHLLCSAWRNDSGTTFSGERRAGDPESLVADPSFLSSIGVTEMIDWRAGVTAYAEWFRGARGRYVS